MGKVRLKHKKNIGIVIMLGLLSMLMPLAIDMYLPALPIIAEDYKVSNGDVQMTLSSYVFGFAVGQLFYGPMADCFGRKPIIVFGTFFFSLAAAACAFSPSIKILIYMRMLHGLAAAGTSVVINALMRDIFTKEEFSRMMSFVMLIMTIAPLLAPIIGGSLLILLSWHAIFWVIGVAALVETLLVLVFIRETLPRERRQIFHYNIIIGNFNSLLQHKRVLSYMLASGFSFAGMFSFLSSGPFVYIDLNGVSPQNFGYYFSVNIIFLFILTLVNSRFVMRFGAKKMFRLGIISQFFTSLCMIVVLLAHLGFIPLVFGVALFVGSLALITSNGMALILEEFSHIAGTASSLAGVLRFSIGAAISALLSFSKFKSEWPMILSMTMCSSVSLLFYCYASRLPKNGILSSLVRANKYHQ